MHVSVFPCLSLSWPRRATGPSKSPMVSWGCDSSASPNLMKLTHWCTKTQFHLFDIYKFQNTHTKDTLQSLHFIHFRFSKKNPQLDPPVFPAARGLTWNRPMSPTPTSTAAGNEAIGPSIRAPGVFCPVQKILTFLLRLFKKSLFLRKKSQVKKESHQTWTLMTIKTSFLHWLHLKRFKRACVAETPGATSLHRVGSFTCFFAR